MTILTARREQAASWQVAEAATFSSWTCGGWAGGESVGGGEGVQVRWVGGACSLRVQPRPLSQAGRQAGRHMLVCPAGAK